MKRFILLFCVMLSSTALAHPGHAPAGVVHGLVHVLWVVQAVVLLSATIAVGVRWIERRQAARVPRRPFSGSERGQPQGMARREWLIPVQKA